MVERRRDCKWLDCAMVKWLVEMSKKYLKLNDIDAYRVAFHLSNFVWDEKAKTRKLIAPTTYETIFIELQKLPLLINQLIKYTNQTLKI
jgi:hypothetical protein